MGKQSSPAGLTLLIPRAIPEELEKKTKENKTTEIEMNDPQDQGEWSFKKARGGKGRKIPLCKGIKQFRANGD